ncbi:hypothetical protein NQ314_019010 [Rhamnusium bicolor]|uniref:Uncharacterized protein n=1 Tax=Rhamnusium bicolor TaxID=1586634 RepID=A0AAV8WRM9_9CUCU|nr:hypothetical protein NQ314_019010 [Rhamnusium bicolor]
MESTATKSACYESNWTECELVVRKVLIIIAERSKRPLFLTAGKFSMLSLASFTGVRRYMYMWQSYAIRLFAK